MLLFTLAGCFPTPQSARLEPGLKLTASAVGIPDQTRNGEDQPPDYVFTLGPAYGFGDRTEVGVPLGVYWEHGLGASSAGYDSGRTFVVMPYVKLALAPEDARTHAALSFQSVWLLPANVGLHVGRDLGTWESQLSLTLVLSAGPAGDDPVVTRYQEAGQRLLVPAIGATWFGPGRPMLLAGLLLDHHREGAVYGDFGQPTRTRTLLDLFVGFSVTTPR